MKKILTIVLIFCLCFSSMFIFTSCNEEEHSIADVQNKYIELVESFNQEDSSNLFFSGNTLKVTFTNPTLNFEISSGKHSNAFEQRFYALSLYDKLFKEIFSYYETYQSSFYTSVDTIPKKDINALYSRLSVFESRLKDFHSKYEAFQEELEFLGYTNPPVITVTSFTYEYNRLAESAINFANMFISLHKSYVFGEEQDDENALIRTVEEAKFNLARFVYLENFKCLNNVSGKNGACDLAPLINAYFNDDNNEYVLVKLLDYGNLECSYNSANLAKLKYFRDSFNQNFVTYNNIYKKFDMYNLSLNRLNAFSGANLEAYISRFSNVEIAQYKFLENYRTRILDSYLKSLENMKNA